MVEFLLVSAQFDSLLAVHIIMCSLPGSHVPSPIQFYKKKKKVIYPILYIVVLT